MKYGEPLGVSVEAMGRFGLAGRGGWADHGAEGKNGGQSKVRSFDVEGQRFL